MAVMSLYIQQKNYYNRSCMHVFAYVLYHI